MSHLHFPDGILPIWLWVLGWITTAAALAFVGTKMKKQNNYSKQSVVGVFAALMLIGMSLEIVPIGYHLNLSVLTGIIVGPLYGLPIAFIVNLLLALMGHSGLSVLGLNFLVIGSEIVIGWLIFQKLIGKYLKNIFAAGALTVVAALLISTAVSFGIIATGVSDLHQAIHSEEHDGLIGFSLLPETEDHHEYTEEEEHESVNLLRLASILFGLGAIGWIIEGVATGFILAYLQRVKPDLISNHSHDLT